MSNETNPIPAPVNAPAIVPIPGLMKVPFMAPIVNDPTTVPCITTAFASFLTAFVIIKPTKALASGVQRFSKRSHKSLVQSSDVGSASTRPDVMHQGISLTISSLTH